MSHYHGSKISGSQQSNDNSDSNKITVQKQKVYVSKTTTLRMHHAFLYIFQLSLQDCHKKLPNFVPFLYGVGKHDTKILFFST